MESIKNTVLNQILPKSITEKNGERNAQCFGSKNLRGRKISKLSLFSRPSVQQKFVFEFRINVITERKFIVQEMGNPRN